MKHMPLVDSASSWSTLDQLRKIRSSANAIGTPMPQPRKSYNFDSFDEYTDEEDSFESGDDVADLPSVRATRLSRRSARGSNTSDSSELSNARTMERASSGSVTSLLEDDFPELSSNTPSMPKAASAADMTVKKMPKPMVGPDALNLAGWRRIS